MKTNLTFFIARDLSPHLTNELAKLSIKSSSARELQLEFHIDLIDYCISNEMIIVTKDKKMYKRCRRKNQPIVFVENGSAKSSEVVTEINKFIHLSKITSLAA